MTSSEYSSEIEIGRGEDADIEWTTVFSIIDEIDLLLGEFEIAIPGSYLPDELGDLLSELREQEPSIPIQENFYRGFDLIRDHPLVFVKREFHDPNMPVSSNWYEIFVAKKNVRQVLQILQSAMGKFAQLHNDMGVEEKVRRFEEKRNREREIADRELRRREKIEQKRLRAETAKSNKRKAADALDEISSILENLEGLHQVGNFLIDASENEIFVITAHSSYRRSREVWEKALTKDLQKNFPVFEIKESSPPGSSHIPHFAGAGRLTVMGWNQLTSILSCSDSEGLKRAVANRQKFNCGTG
jgi:hypothetical protein